MVFIFSIRECLLYHRKGTDFLFGAKALDSGLPCSFGVLAKETMMDLSVNTFGDVLISRPAGKDAFLMAKAYIFNSLKPNETINLDFIDVKVLTPSWLDEFISGIRLNFKNRIAYINTTNESVAAALNAVLNY